MSYVRQGSLTAGTKALQPGARTEIDDIGVARRTETYILNTPDLFSLAPQVDSQSTTFPNLYVKRVNAVGRPAGLTEMTVDYAGLSSDTGGTGVSTALPPPVYSLEGSLSGEPIETNPNFQTWLTDAADSGIDTNKWFDDDGRFVGFDKTVLNSATLFELFGVDSYLEPGLIWRKRYVTRSRPSSFDELGKISDPEGPAPRISNRNWLLTEASYEKEGRIYSVSKAWQLSGRNGWSNLIYGDG